MPTTPIRRPSCRRSGRTLACGTTGGSTGGSSGSHRARRSTITGREPGRGARPRRADPRAPVPDRPLAGPEPPDDSLLAAVASLPPKQRAAVVLRHLLDRPYPEIAEIFGSTEEAARANVRAGLATLRERVR